MLGRIMTSGRKGKCNSRCLCDIGVGILVPLALDTIGVETATSGVETGIPMPKEAGVEIGVGICYRH